jgi:putative membrane-bound dehydrogenase-like protein
MKRHLLTVLVFAFSALGLPGRSVAAETKQILMIAGKPSHGPGAHEHNAGVQLLAKCLRESGLPVEVKFQLNGEWPAPEAFAKADSIVIYSDGGGGHPALQENRLAELDKEMKRGAGLVCIHYAVEPTIEKGNKEFIDWLGGAFEINWSVNPHWDANFKELPKHPISNGVKPFATNDEWYFHMRFRPNMKGVTPILSDVAPDATMSRPDGHHSGNPAVREAVKNKEPQHVAWAVEREDGGRGFGFTGGHFHAGWKNDDQRKLVLNAIAWTAKVEVPADGVKSSVTDEDMNANLDPKPVKPAPKKKADAPKAKTAAAPAPGAKPLFRKEVGKGSVVDVKVDLKGAKELYLVAHEGPDGIACDWTDWVEPTLVMADGKRTKLTELKMKQAVTGFGGVVINKNCQGEAMAIEGYVPSGKQDRVLGIGTHSNSVIAFDLPEGAASFEAKVGLDSGGTKQGQNNKVVAMVFTAEPSKQYTGAEPAKKPYGFDEAKQQMADFKTADGLEATLFAAEPMVQNPTNIDIDPRGRVWVAENVNYRSGFKAWGVLRESGDRVMILADTNGDGEADKETVFHESREYNNTLGICVLPQAKGTKVILSSAPWIWLLTDEDGDDRAEKAEKLFKVGGNPEHDHNVHAMVFGPDGKFYFNFGNEGRTLMHPDDKPVTDLAGNEVNDKGAPYRQGMIFRCDIDLQKATFANVETLGHNFRNNYEVCVDSFGGMWQSDNDDDGNKGVRINAILDYGSYGYTDEKTGAGWRTERTNIEEEIPLRHWHLNDPGTVPNLLQTGGGSPTGICVNEGAALGKRFAGEVIHCDAGPRTVRAYPVKKVGAGYTAEMVDILTTEDTWYRPSDVCIAPDGSLFIADWYDPGVGGHNMGDNSPNEIRGRLYRVTQKGAPSKTAAPNFATLDGCIEALKSPNNSTRYVAWQKLHEMTQGPAITRTVTKDKSGSESVSINLRGDKSAVGDAEKALKSLYATGSSRQRARALHLLLRVPGKARAYLDAALDHEMEEVRVTAARELRLATATQDAVPKSMVSGTYPHLFKENETAADIVLERAARESNKQVLREFALTLRVVKPAAQDKTTNLEVADQTEPGGKKEPVKLVIVSKPDSAPQAWVALAQKHDGRDRWYLEALGIGSMGREDACFDAWLKSVGKDGWNTAAGRDIVWRVRSTAAPDLLAALLTMKKADGATLPRYLRSFDFLPDGDAKNAALLKVAVSGTTNAAVTTDALKRISNTPLKDKPEVKSALDGILAAVKGKPDFIEIVSDFKVADRNTEVLDAALADVHDPRAITAVKLLLTNPEGRKLVIETLGTDKAEKLASLLGGSGVPGALKLLEDLVTKPEAPLPVRTAAVKALSLSAGGATTLVELAEANKLPDELRPATGAALAMVAYPGISERAAKHFPPPQAAGGQALPPIAELVKLKGDIEKGRAIYAKAESTCTLCHRIGDIGADFGPGLAEIGSKLGKDVLYESILNPNAGVSMGFETWSITLKNGQAAMGIVRSETNDQLVLALPGGVANTFDKRQIDKREKLATTMMPTGLQALFSKEDLVNLVEYLSSLKTKVAKK